MIKQRENFRIFDKLSNCLRQRKIILQELDIQKKKKSFRT